MMTPVHRFPRRPKTLVRALSQCTGSRGAALLSEPSERVLLVSTWSL